MYRMMGIYSARMPPNCSLKTSVQRGLGSQRKVLFTLVLVTFFPFSKVTYEEAYFLAADNGAVIGVNGHLHDYFEKIYLLQGQEPPLTGFTPTMLVTHYIYTHFH